MLSNTCFQSCCDIADEIMYCEREFIDVNVAGKLVDAMFSLKEVEITICQVLTDETEIISRGGTGVVHILLASASSFSKKFVFDVDSYVDFLVKICEANARLEQSFYLYRFTVMAEQLEHELGEMSVHILDQVCKRMHSQTH